MKQKEHLMLLTLLVCSYRDDRGHYINIWKMRRTESNSFLGFSQNVVLSHHYLVLFEIFLSGVSSTQVTSQPEGHVIKCTYSPLSIAVNSFSLIVV